MLFVVFVPLVFDPFAPVWTVCISKLVAWAALNANAKLKLERAEFVGWDARTARARHADEANREHARRHTCAWASAAYERRSDGDPNRFYRSRD